MAHPIERRSVGTLPHALFIQSAKRSPVARITLTRVDFFHSHRHAACPRLRFRPADYFHIVGGSGNRLATVALRRHKRLHVDERHLLFTLAAAVGQLDRLLAHTSLVCNRAVRGLDLASVRGQCGGGRYDRGGCRRRRCGPSGRRRRRRSWSRHAHRAATARLVFQLLTTIAHDIVARGARVVAVHSDVFFALARCALVDLPCLVVFP